MDFARMHISIKRRHRQTKAFIFCRRHIFIESSVSVEIRPFFTKKSYRVALCAMLVIKTTFAIKNACLCRFDERQILNEILQLLKMQQDKQGWFFAVNGWLLNYFYRVFCSAKDFKGQLNQYKEFQRKLRLYEMLVKILNKN